MKFGVVSLVLMIGVLVVVVLMYLFVMPVMFTEKPPVVPQNPKYQDPTLSIDERVADLLSYMTLEEKIGQMALVERNSLAAVKDIEAYHLGALLSGSGSKPADNSASGWREMIASYQAAATSSRLGIPLLYGTDAVHGHAHVPGMVVFPHQIGLGATGNRELVEKIGAATAVDIRRSGANWNFGPNLDLPTDIRWGRVYEAFSDDPRVAAELGSAYLTGLQTPVGEGERLAVLGTLKHYIGLGSMMWGTSANRNFKIDQGMTPADETLLREQYLVPFTVAIENGALSVMVGLNFWGDTKTIFSHELLTQQLKTELGFDGFVVSDWYGVYEGQWSTFLANIKAINAGVDMVMLPFDYRTFVREMKWANRLGLIPTARIDDAVRRILRAKFALGLFDAAPRELLPTETAIDAEHRALARQAVAESLVLLKNTDAVLPIQSAPKHIRVAGSAADNIGRQSGAWTVEWQGVDGNWLPGATSILAGITAAVPRGVTLEYAPDGRFVTGTKADLGIAIVGEAPYAEGWGDRDLPILSDEDRLAIEQLEATCERVVIVVVAGRPLLMTEEIQEADAVVMAWLPGSEGAGVADVLFGTQPFSGTLPLPWPERLEQLPLSLEGTTADGTPVLFKRSFGLK